MIFAKLVRLGLLLAGVVQVVSGQGVIWGEEVDACEYNSMSGGKAHEKTKVAIRQGKIEITKSRDGRIMGISKGAEAIGNTTSDFYLNHAPSSALFSTNIWDRVRNCYDQNGNEHVNSRFTKMSDFTEAVKRKVNLPPFEIATADPTASWFKQYTTKWCCVVLHYRPGDATSCEQIAFQLQVNEDQCSKTRPSYCPICPTGIVCS